MRKLRLTTLVVSILIGLTGCVGWWWQPPEGAGTALQRYPTERAVQTLLMAFHPDRVAAAAALGVRAQAISPAADKQVEQVGQLPESLRLIRIPEAREEGARATGMRVVLFDKFQEFPDHGDLVAAIVAATAPEAAIYFCDIFKYSVDYCAAGLIYALQKGEKYDVLSNSWAYVDTWRCYMPDGSHFDKTPGDIRLPEHFKTLQQQYGMMIVASAGNEGRHNCETYPAAYPDVVSAGAVYDAFFNVAAFRLCTDYNVKPDDITCWSNWGDIFAPGWRQDINIGDQTRQFGGTSAAAPFTSATLVTLKASCPLAAKPEEVINWLVKNADPINPRFDFEYLPHRRINALASYRACRGGAPPPPPPPPSLWDWIDANDNCVIDDAEILEAVRYWVEGRAWDGGPISDAEILDAVRLWITGEKVC